MFGLSPKTKLTDTLSVSTKTATEALEARSKVRTAIDRAKQIIDEAEAEVESSMRSLGAEAAANLLDGLPTGDSEDLVRRARDRAASHRNALPVLEDKLIETEAAVIQALPVFRRELDAFARSQVSVYHADLEKVTDALTAVLRRGHALGESLNQPGLVNAVLATNVPDPLRPESNLAAVMVYEFDKAADRPIDKPTWPTDNKAVELHASFAPLTTLLRTLEAEANTISRRQHDAAQQALDVERAARPAFTFSGGRDYDEAVYHAPPPPEPGPVVSIGVGAYIPPPPGYVAPTSGEAA